MSFQKRELDVPEFHGRKLKLPADVLNANGDGSL